MKRQLCIPLGSSAVRHVSRYVSEAPIFSETGENLSVSEYHDLKPCTLNASDFNLKQLVLSGVEPDNFVAFAQRSKFGLLNSIN